MKKILWIPQLATVDKQSGKIIINADSNITILNGIADSLHEQFEFVALLPAQDSCNCMSYDALSPSIFRCINLTKAHTSSFSLRYDFDFEEVKKIIDVEQPDFIVNNTPSLTRNLKAVLYVLGNKTTKLINFLHFLDLPGEDKVPKEISYFMRQCEGMLCADLAVFQSYTVRDKALEAINRYFRVLKEYINPEMKVAVWNATYSQSEIDKYKDTPKFEKKTILFPNRLSSTNYSNHLRFFEAIRNIAKTRDDFQVIVNNPTKYMSYEEIAKVCPNLKVMNNGELMSREMYFKTLNASDIGVALFVQEGHGGVSSKEFQAAGCLPVFPMVNEYQHLMPKAYGGFCAADLHDLEEALNCVLDVSRTEIGKLLVETAKKLIYERDSFEFNAKNVKKDLEEL